MNGPTLMQALAGPGELVRVRWAGAACAYRGRNADEDPHKNAINGAQASTLQS
jgi:hypothetical protein